MVNETLLKRALPKLMSKEEMMEILLREEYGYMPPRPDGSSSASIVSDEIKECHMHNYCAGKATIQKFNITSKIYGEDFTFPIYVTIPKGEGKHPFFVHINFRPNVPDMYLPIEEIVDRGFAVISFCYKDVTSDDGNFDDGIAEIITRHIGRGASTPGKIAMWAWAAQRALDFAYTLDCLDLENAAVCGHSRLGKTALLAAATDERFKFAYSNDSGCSGAAIARGTAGETVEDICRVFPYWFCENYKKYVNNESNMPFDQHYLIASIAPRYVYVASAEEDAWADPTCEFLSCVAASEEYERYGLRGVVHNGEIPAARGVLHGGEIGYHIRKGTHYMSREDWNLVIDFINEKKN